MALFEIIVKHLFDNCDSDKVLETVTRIEQQLAEFINYQKLHNMSVEAKLQAVNDSLEKVYAEVQGIKSLNDELKDNNVALRQELEERGIADARIEELVSKSESIATKIDDIIPDAEQPVEPVIPDESGGNGSDGASGDDAE